MRKGKALRLAGFVGATCASVALVATAVETTGAYFTDSHNGNINAGSGQIKVDVTPGDGQLNFANLLPGEYQTLPISYTAHPAGGTEDIWLVFPNYGQSGDAFTSNPAKGPTPLGQYGHFAISAPAGSFTSYNLALSPNGGENSADSCTITADGHGGSAAQLPNASDATTDALKYCAPAQAILLQSNMANNDSGQAKITFGFTPLLNGDPNATSPVQLESFKIVATQHGIRPDNSFNGS